MKSILDSRQLLAARVLADTGSFTVTGQQLCLTQSAVSHAIKALEDEVECKLFTRTGKGVTVTHAGKHFLQYLDKILGHMETARTLVMPRTTHGKERLRLGVSTRAREFIIPVVLPAFHKIFPSRLAMIEPGEYRNNLELLQSGMLDLAFTVRPERSSELGYIHLFEDELRFVVSAAHPWARRGRASPDDLANDTLLLYQDYNNIPGVLAEHLRTERIAARHGVELPDHQSIKALVHTGRAVGVLPPWLVSAELREGSLISLPIGSTPLLRHWGLAHLLRRPLAEMDRRFVELCQQAVPGILSRLHGQPLLAHEKKVSTMPVVEPEIQFGGVALLAMWAINFVGQVLSGENGLLFLCG